LYNINMLKKTKKDLKDALSYAEKLLRSKGYDPKEIDRDAVPKDIGVYIWRDKSGGKVVYVGSALGKKGLYQRIVTQHLSKSYTGSMFKRHVAEEQNIDIKQATFNYIENNFKFSFVAVKQPQRHLVLLIEEILIYEYQPKYNKRK
jgi:excinuclease UvrABC nuclease subunit